MVVAGMMLGLTMGGLAPVRDSRIPGFGGRRGSSGAAKGRVKKEVAGSLRALEGAPMAVAALRRGEGVRSRAREEGAAEVLLAGIVR